MVWPQDPVIYEVNTAIWLESLSRSAGRHLTLADVSPSDWDAVTPEGVDAVWLMGVWERSPAGLAIAKANDALMASFRDALPDLTDDDIIGSPYCVRRYVADDRFGGTEGLATARAALTTRGKRLILDYVPNHVAPDHPWVSEHPERFIQGSSGDLAADPASWTAVGSTVLALGRDPYFPAWPDVVQLNAFSAELRTATAQVLGDIADQCDGIRCDMAMLMTSNVFAKTWSGRAGTEPGAEFWPAVIADLRVRHPETVLLAEAYWDLEWELQQQGFDFCYDKRLYDRLFAQDVSQVHDHVRADVSYQARLVRFLENHDEPRAASRVAGDVERAMAAVVATLPGATLWHEGQFEGRRVHPPVFLRRRPDEAPEIDLADWYRQLVAVVAREGVRSGGWQLLETTGWPDNDTCRNLLAWSWSGEGVARRHVVVVNLSGTPAEGRVPLPWADLPGSTHHLTDCLGGLDIDRDGDELTAPGLFVAMDPWQHQLFGIS